MRGVKYTFNLLIEYTVKPQSVDSGIFFCILSTFTVEAENQSEYHINKLYYYLLLLYINIQINIFEVII